MAVGIVAGVIIIGGVVATILLYLRRRPEQPTANGSALLGTSLLHPPGLEAVQLRQDDIKVIGLQYSMYEFMDRFISLAVP